MDFSGLFAKRGGVMNLAKWSINSKITSQGETSVRLRRADKINQHMYVCLKWPGNRFSCLFLRLLPGDMCPQRGIVTSDQSKDQWNKVSIYSLPPRLPTERRCHVTAGVAKHANTSSVLLKWVRWGLATAWPRHWPHIRTWPLWVLAADVWLVWHAATSTILVTKTEVSDVFRRHC